jgi:hypothetical protein
MHTVSCAVDSTDNAITPDDTKKQGDYSSAAWHALGFHHNPSYFRFEIDNPGSLQCHIPANTAPIYNLRAVGDLDADGTTSLFEVSVASTSDNELYRSRGFYIANESE